MGLAHRDARAGAAISIPTATVLFALAAPFAIDMGGFSWPGLLAFCGVGLIYPGVVTRLTFRSNAEVGPTVTAAVSGTAPLVAIAAAGLLLGEHVPSSAVAASLAVAAGVALISWPPSGGVARFPARALAWAGAGTLARGLAQVAAKAALLQWPSPFAAGLAGYLVSSGVVIAAGVARRRVPARGMAWFAATGVLNGAAVLLMYAALARAPVSQVAPVVAAYPLVTTVVSAVVLRERLTTRMVAGVVMMVVAIVWLVAA
jgi:drug/metabolite transporter (DMT)-like permease